MGARTKNMEKHGAEGGRSVLSCALLFHTQLLEFSEVVCHNKPPRVSDVPFFFNLESHWRPLVTTAKMADQTSSYWGMSPTQGEGKFFTSI